MVLTPQQARRYYRLFDQLVAYVALRLDMLGVLVRRDGTLRDEGILEVAQALWETRQNIGLIDDYLAENPDGLGSADRREVASWKEGVYADFAILREGSSTFFLYGDHAFAVRGLNNEVDKVIAASLPAFASTAIMPFDGLITYCTCMSALPVSIGPNMVRSMADGLTRAREEGKCATTARQLMQMMPDAREEHLQHEAEDFARQTELEMNAHELAQDQHEGVLVGLSWEDREKAIDAHIKEEGPFRNKELVYALVDSWCTKGAPVHTLEGALGKLDRKQLMEAARRFEVPGVLSKMGKQKLVKLVASATPRDQEVFLGTALMSGERAVHDLRWVYEAGGRVDVPTAEVTRGFDVPEPQFPTTQLFKVGDTYSCVMIDEAREAFAEVDWELELATGRFVDEVLRRIDLMVEFRGVVELVEAMREALTGMDMSANPGVEVLLHALRQRIDAEQTCFDMVIVDEVTYLAHFDITGYDEAEFDEGYVLDILDAQEGKEPRPMAEVWGKYRALIDWVLDRPAARNLTAYLDAHVPNDRDDYYFADRVVEDVVFLSRDQPDIHEILETIQQDGLLLTEAQLNYLLELLTELINDVPCWANNGWTPMELHEMTGW